MKFFLLIALAIVSLAAAAQLPDSATQGPNPQDIATPEPEYIDIDVPEPPRSAAQAAPVAAPQPIQSRFANSVSSSSSSFSAPRPAPRPSSSYLAPVQQRVHYQPIQQQQQQQQQQLPGHTFNSQSGYQYRRPVIVRRVYRRRY